MSPLDKSHQGEFIVPPAIRVREDFDINERVISRSGLVGRIAAMYNGTADIRLDDGTLMFGVLLGLLSKLPEPVPVSGEVSHSKKYTPSYVRKHTWTPSTMEELHHFVVQRGWCLDRISNQFGPLVASCYEAALRAEGYFHKAIEKGLELKTKLDQIDPGSPSPEIARLKAWLRRIKEYGEKDDQMNHDLGVLESGVRGPASGYATAALEGFPADADTFPDRVKLFPTDAKPSDYQQLKWIASAANDMINPGPNWCGTWFKVYEDAVHGESYRLLKHRLAVLYGG